MKATLITNTLHDQFRYGSAWSRILVCCLACQGLHAAPLYDWTVRNPSPGNLSLVETAYGNGRFVSIGDIGTVMVSIDGANWSVKKEGTTFHGIAFANNQFIAVGNGGAIATSTDGIDWVRLFDTGTFNTLQGVTFGNNLVVVVGVQGTILTSPDASTWTLRSSGTSQELSVPAFGNGRFVVVGAGGTILASANGVNWTLQSSGTSEYLYEVHFANNQFVAVGSGGKILTSPEGLTWTARTSGTAAALGAVWFGNGLWVAAGAGGAILTSPDGISWTPRSSGVAANLDHVVSGAGTFVAVGAGGVILTSPDATTWTSRQRFATNQRLRSIARDATGWVSVGESGTIVGSADGTNWSPTVSGTSASLFDVASSNGQWVAVGQNGTLLSSANSVQWTARNSGVSATLNGVTFGEGAFVAVGNNGTIIASTNGANWSSVSSGSSSTLNEVTFGGGLFVAVGTNGTVLVSTNRQSWSTRASGTTENLVGVSHGNGLFIAIGSSGATFTSPDTIAWTPQGTVGFSSPRQIAYGNGTFLISAGSTLFSSEDGSNWTYHFPGIYDALYAAAYGNGTFIAVGDNGVIVQSVSFAPPPPVTIESAREFEGDSGYTPLVFRVTLTSEPTEPLSLNFETVADSAQAGSDFMATNGTLVFNPGQSSQSVVVYVLGDQTIEDDEALLLRLTSLTNAAQVLAEATGTILDDDTPIAPEIAVEQPPGNDLSDGSASVNFGSLSAGGGSSEEIFVIRNIGNADLTGLGINITGANAADFTVTTPPAASVPPGGSTTFTVTFAPTAGGYRTATLHLASSDSDESPFDIGLLGTVLVLETRTFANAGSLSIPSFGRATPYPSSIPVVGLAANPTKVTVTLSNLNFVCSSTEVRLRLVGPGAQGVDLTTTGGCTEFCWNSSGTPTFDDGGTNRPIRGSINGTFRPEGGSLSVFTAGNPNGNWQLLAEDFCNAVPGAGSASMTGWSIRFETATVPPPPLAIEQSAGAVRVSWPLPADGFLLEAVGAITGSPVTGWTPVLLPYTTNATHVSITVPIPSGNKYYRLRKP